MFPKNVDQKNRQEESIGEYFNFFNTKKVLISKNFLTKLFLMPIFFCDIQKFGCK